MSGRRNVIVELRVPFCLDDSALCRKSVFSGHDLLRVQKYAAALQREIEANRGQFEDCKAVAIRFCGGQATALGEGLLKCLSALRKTVEVIPDGPISVRAGLSDFNAATATWFMRLRAKRFDLEALSVDPVAFSYLNPRDRLGAIPLIREGYLQVPSHCGLGYVLAYGYKLAGHTDALATVTRCANLIAASDVEHVILERIPRVSKKSDDDAMADSQLARYREVLCASGFSEYLPGIFARPGKKDPFLSLDATGCERIGFGLGAYTLIDGVSSRNTRDFDLYCENSEDYEAITAEVVQKH